LQEPGTRRRAAGGRSRWVANGACHVVGLTLTPVNIIVGNLSLPRPPGQDLNLFSAPKCKWIFELLVVGLQMHLKTRTITPCRCISEFNLITATNCITELLDLGLQIHLQMPLQPGTISASKGISELLDLGLPMHLQMYHQSRSIPASKCISEINSSTVSKCISE
jgi:hypothetical protein